MRGGGWGGLLRGGAGCEFPAGRGDGRHACHLMVVLVDDRARVEAALREAGIGYGIHYPIPLHRQTAFAGRSKAAGINPSRTRSSVGVTRIVCRSTTDGADSTAG